MYSKNYYMLKEVHSETTRSSSTARNAFQERNIKVQKNKSLKGLLKEVQVLCPGKFKNSCERGSPCISMFDFFRIKIEYNSLLKNMKR